jgi:N-acetylglucosaminyl-diphospho-decaprenol L-rhamnosyltransferase
MLLNNLDNLATIDIVIVNWNAGTQLRECLDSLIQYGKTSPNQIILVDNGSIDNSIDNIESMDLPIVVIRNVTNRGFGAACNQGAALAKSEFILFLNPDTRLFKDSLTIPISFMQQPNNSNIGICGIGLVDECGKPSTSAARFPTLQVMAGKILGLSKLLPSVFPPHLMISSVLQESGLVDQVIGAFFLIRSDVFKLCNGFDERFFVYFEEVDLSLRAKQRGYSSYFLSEVSAYHKGGGCSERIKAKRLFYSLRSRILYAQKHYTKIEFLALLALTTIELPLRLAQNIMKLSWLDIKNTSTAYIQLVAYFIRRD